MNNILNTLYAQEGDVKINNIDFHSQLLKGIPYFEKQFNMNNMFELTIFSKSATKVLKQFVYNQELIFDYSNIKLVLEIYEMEQYLMIDMKIDRYREYIETYIDDEQRFDLFLKDIGHFKLPKTLSIEQQNIIKSNIDLYERFLYRKIESDETSIYYIELLILLLKHNKSLDKIKLCNNSSHITLQKITMYAISFPNYNKILI